MRLKHLGTVLIVGMLVVLAVSNATAFGQSNDLSINNIKSVLNRSKEAPKPVPDDVGAISIDELNRRIAEAKEEGKRAAESDLDARIHSAAVKTAADLETERIEKELAARAASRPTIELAAVQSSAPTERRPRGLLMVAEYCQPCERMEAENAQLLGDETAAIQVVNTTRANDLDEYGINLNSIGGFPVLTVIDNTGKVHDVRNGMMACLRRGYSTPDQVTAYLKQHNVDLETNGPPSIVFDVANASAMSATAAALDFVITDAALGDTDEFAFKTFFDVEFDAPDLLRSQVANILQVGKINIPDAGLSVSWPGERTLKTKANRLDIVPGLTVSKTIGRFNASRTLDAITWNDDLSSLNLELRASPDVQIRLR